ncbi:MAG: hypothetical protein KC505_00780 [Myxococcales bacterium]|nr:hypothetical protein [Myxococcales bacterium]USN51354.1 MAG: hypothetical protein H6731_02805 [Myxococcales bacterium]
MKESKKLLHHYEQSLLLVAMLFSRNNLDDILNLFPEEQIWRIEGAKARFLKLEKNERMTQIILELRKLLLVPEHTIAWVHPSWIKDELKKEPLYLRSSLEASLKNITLEQKSIISPKILLQNFLPNFIKTKPKAALFDPALMRLQALNENNFLQVMKAAGSYGIANLAQVLKKQRFEKFISQKIKTVDFLDASKLENPNPFEYKSLRSVLIKIICVTHKLTLEKIGLSIAAAYLSFHKSRWHSAIEYALPKTVGLELREKITLFSNKKLEQELKPLLAAMLVNGMDDAFI